MYLTLTTWPGKTQLLVSATEATSARRAVKICKDYFEKARASSKAQGDACNKVEAGY